MPQTFPPGARTRFAPNLLRLVTVLLFSGLAFAACDGTDPVEPDPEVTIAELAENILPEDTVQLSASLVNARDNEPTTIVFSSSNPSVLTVSPQGQAIGVTPGTATVSASAQGSSATLQVEVIAGAVAENTVIPEEAGLVLTSDSASVASGNLEFTNNGGASIEVGDVLMGAELDGYVRRVTAVNASGSTVAVTAEEAALTDAVEDLEVDITPDISLESALQAYENAVQLGLEPGMPEGFEIIPRSPGQTGSAQRIGYTFDRTVPLGTVAFARVMAGGSLDMLFGSAAGPGMETFKIRGKIKPWGIKRFRMSTAARVVFDAGASVEVSPNGINLPPVFSTRSTSISNPNAPSITLTKKPGPNGRPVPGTTCTFISGIPVCYKIVLSLENGAVVTANGYGRVSSNFRFDRGAEMGARYRDGSWSPIFVPVGPGISTEMTVEDAPDMTLRVYIEPRITVYLYGIFGPFFGLQGYVDTRGMATPYHAGFTGHIGMDGNVGLALSMIGSIPGANYQFSIIQPQEIFNFTEPLARIEAGPNPMNLLVGESQSLNVRAFRLADGVEIDPPPSNTLIYATGDASIASISGSGVVTGQNAGQTPVAVAYQPFTTIQSQIPVNVTSGPFSAITPSSFSVQHIYAETSCPQTMGQLRVRNVVDGDILVRIRAFPVSNAISVSPSTSFTRVGPGNETFWTVSFNCASPEDIEDNEFVIEVYRDGNPDNIQTTRIPVEVDVVGYTPAPRPGGGN